MDDVGLHLMGRNTYEEMAEFWPASDDAYAAAMNEIPKLVFSRTVERAEWADSRIARGDLAQEIAALKREPGKDMLAWGGATLAQSLSRLGLIDEYRLILQLSRWSKGSPSSKISPHRCGSSSSTRRHTPPARRCTSTGPRLRPREHPRWPSRRHTIACPESRAQASLAPRVDCGCVANRARRQ